MSFVCHHHVNFIFLPSCHRLTVPRVEHSIPVIWASGDPCFREGQLVAVHPGPHPGHHHRHEFPGGPARGGLHRPPPVLPLLLRQSVVSLFNHPGELQLRTVWRPEAQGQTEPTALLHWGVREEARKETEREQETAFSWKKTLTISFPPVHFSVSLLPQRGRSLDTRTTRKPLISSN